MTHEANKRTRALDGTYKHEPGACVCDHALGDHDAERARYKGKYVQYCQAPGCACECFKKAKKA